MGFVNYAAGLPVAQAGLKPAQQLPGVIQLLDFKPSRRRCKYTWVEKSDLEYAPRRAYTGDRFLEVHIGVVHLDAIISTVCDINRIALLVDSDAMRRAELILPLLPCVPTAFTQVPSLAHLNEA